MGRNVSHILEVRNLADFGYVRVSAVDQNEDRQMLEMLKLKIAIKNIYIDKQSGNYLTVLNTRNC